MRAHTDDKHLPPFRFGPGHQMMDARDVGAGGVDHAAAPCRQRLMDRPSLPMGTDDDRRALRDLFRRLRQRYPLGLQAL